MGDRTKWKTKAGRLANAGLVLVGVATFRPLDLPAPLLEEMLRLFQASIDAILTARIAAIPKARRLEAVALCFQPGQDMRQTFLTKARGRFEVRNTDPGNVLRSEFGFVQQTS
jgi:hypothetical protein